MSERNKTSVIVGLPVVAARILAALIVTGVTTDPLWKTVLSLFPLAYLLTAGPVTHAFYHRMEKSTPDVLQYAAICYILSVERTFMVLPDWYAETWKPYFDFWNPAK